MVQEPYQGREGLINVTLMSVQRCKFFQPGEAKVIIMMHRFPCGWIIWWFAIMLPKFIKQEKVHNIKNG